MEPAAERPVYRVLDTDWYDADTLRDTPVFQDKRATRFSIINTHKLNQGVDFVYTEPHDPTKVKATHDNRTDRVLLSCTWVREWLEVAPRSQNGAATAHRLSKRPRIMAREEEESSAGDLTEELDERDMDEEEAPRMLLSEVAMPSRVTVNMLPAIQLEEEDWFMGMDITFRGERHPDHIYTRGPDVAKLLETRLELKARRSLAPSHFITVYEGEQAITYFRYIGLVSFLFSVRKKGIVEKFQSWATRVLFAFQFRPATGTSMTRIPQSLCKPFFRISAGEVTGFFACWIQSVDALRQDIRIPNEIPGGPGRGVYRIGFSANLAFEMAVLKDKCAMLSSTVQDDLQLAVFAFIDPTMFAPAEREWNALAIPFQGCFFQLFGVEMGLYALHESDLPKLKSIAYQLRLRCGIGVAQHTRREVTNELTTIHQQEIEKLRQEHQSEMLEMRRLLHQKRA